MSKHKPGPWTLCYDGQIDAADGSTVCRFQWNSFKEFSESDEAPTARLIAAAPELLAALESMLEDAGCFEKHMQNRVVIEAARAAIAKATGAA